MKILITNGVSLNTGDAAIILSIVELLRTQFGENTEFIIYDPNPSSTKKYYPELVWRKWIYSQLTQPNQTELSGNSLLERIFKRISRWKSIINLRIFYFAAWCHIKGFSFITKVLLNKEQFEDLCHYSSADLIISTGGTYLIEDYPLEPRIFDYQISLLMEKPLGFYTQSLGPFSLESNRNSLRDIFNKSAFILLRDELSLKHIQDLEISEQPKINVSSDVVFSYKYQLKPTSEEKNLKLENHRLKIAISVRFWQAFKTVPVEVGVTNYRSVMCVLTQYLVEKYNAEITYISTCQGIPEYWTDDSKFATEICDLLPDTIQQQVKVNRNYHHPETLLEILKTYDVVIGTRMHMCILSLIAGTPVFPIAYEFKTKELFARLGMSKWVQDIETINKATLITSIEDFLANLPQFRDDLMAKVDQERSRAIKSGILVKESLEDWQKNK